MPAQKVIACKSHGIDRGGGVLAIAIRMLQEEKNLLFSKESTWQVNVSAGTPALTRLNGYS